MTTVPIAESHVLHVSLDVFDGPLDLLLGLVREQRLDVATVPLARLAEQYLAYLSSMTALDVERAGEYLVIAATLVFLKSKALLPPIPSDLLPEGEESAEEAEARLRGRLIVYSRYRETARLLRERADGATGTYARSCGDPAGALVQRYALDAAGLLRAMHRVLDQGKPERRTILRDRYDVVRQIDYVLRMLRTRGTTSFAVLCRGFERGRIVATFLAVLDLLRMQRLRYEQHALDAPLLLHSPAPEAA